MTVQHRDIPEAQLHEPKGVSTAQANQTYVADGATSGSWSEPEPKGVGSALAGNLYIADGAGSGSWTDPGGAIFGSAYFATNSTATVISATDTPVIVDPGSWATTVTDTIVFDTNKFIVPEDGIFEISMSGAFSGGGGGGGNEYRFHFRKNGVTLATAPCATRVTSSSDIGSISMSTYQQFALDDEISIEVRNMDATNNPTVTGMSFTIVLLKAL